MGESLKKWQDLVKLAEGELERQHFNFLAVAIVDFNNNSFRSFELSKQKSEGGEEVSSPFIFDLASLTKPLYLNTLYLMYPQKFSPEMLLLLEHRGGLPSWARLSKNNWRGPITAYEIKASKVLYSDLSAIRLMLELEKKLSSPLTMHVQKIWDDGLQYWPELAAPRQCPPTGLRGGREVRGVVHDDNAFMMQFPSSHAGLFSSIGPLCQTLLSVNKNFHLIQRVLERLKASEHRFVLGWDRVLRPRETLAGEGHSSMTFGHLGFTGTSIWIDGKSSIGHIILSNATENYCYDRGELNKLRKKIGGFIWKNKWN